MNPANDPCVVSSREKLKYLDQFNGLHPVNGQVTGAQARDFFLQSQLPPLVLGQIWALADTDADGKMTLIEFSIACKLINLKLRGFEVPKQIPPTLLCSLTTAGGTPIMTPPGQMSPLLFNRPIMGHQPPVVPPPPVIAAAAAPLPTVEPLISPLGAHHPPAIPPQPKIPPQPMVAHIPPAIPPQPMHIPAQPAAVAPILPPSLSQEAVHPMLIKKPSGGNLLDSLENKNDISLLTNGAAPKPPSQPGTRSGSISDPSAIPYEAKPLDWAVKSATKLKYTQLFNNTDSNRLGYLTGPQARNIMVMTKLPQAILAQIWNLSDMDSDGKLSCDEFVLSMHLCEMGLRGEPIPTVLPTELIPPSFRKASTSRSGSRHDSISSQGKSPEAEQHPSGQAMLVNQSSFEDKRKLNFDKGQAELERRRKVLEDAQKREREERERKEREELEKREKLRLEAERKKQEELERQLQMQREMEQEREDERKRQLEAKEAAQKEMERQRQLEWEKTKLQEMENQRQREQEGLLKLKSQNQTYTVELSSLTEKIKGLSQQICETRSNVTTVKTVIDGMRTTRDTSNSEMAALKTKIKEQNAKLVQLSQEKVRVDTRSKEVLNNEEAFSNRQLKINQLKDKLESTKQQMEAKSGDIVTHATELTDLKGQLTDLIATCEDLYSIYEVQRSQVVELKEKKQAEAMNAKWDDAGSAWDSAPAAAATVTTASAAPASSTNGMSAVVAGGSYVNHRALYAFEGRNSDELSFEPGDIIQVLVDQAAEPGWLAGQLNDRTGWFPDAYVEVCGEDAAAPVAVVAESGFVEEPISVAAAAAEPVRSILATAAAATPVEPVEAGEYYVAAYPYESGEPGDLTFEAGESILVVRKDGDWWTGKVGFRVGIFPANYVIAPEEAGGGQDVGVVAVTAVPVVEEVPVSISQPAVAAMAAAVEPAMTSDQYQEAESGAQQDVDSEVSEINTKPAAVDNIPQSASQTPSLKAKKSEIAQVIAPYEATTAEQLSLSRGQLIMIRKKTDSGWWEGELQAKGRKKQVGWFPATYVKVLQGGRNSGRNTPLSASRVDLHETILDKVIALYPYKAQNDDELSFEKDDIISVVGREEPEWWRGELNGLSGLFPSNYVGKFVTSGNV